MNDRFLYNLQKDILNRRGVYILYLLLFILFFVITIKEMRLFFNIVRLFLSVIALLSLILVYLRCGSDRDKREDKIITNNILFFFILTVASIYGFIK